MFSYYRVGCNHFPGMAREHENLGVRGSCFYALNLISKTDVGALAVEQHNIIPSKKEFHHVFNICQKLQYKNLSKINVRYSYAGSEGDNKDTFCKYNYIILLLKI